MLEGVTVCGGVAIGPVRLRGYELERPLPRRIPTTEVEAQIARFRRAVARSATQVEEFRVQLAGGMGDAENRILSVHLAYLKDAAFLKDVENRIRGEQLGLEDALAHAVRDFDRIFELVESERMKERALDLRDVALRVIRNLDETADGAEGGEGGADPYILCARKLSLADIFHLGQGQLLGIVAEEGGITSHAGILARSMHIPTVTGVANLREHLRDGDFVILDAGTGAVHVKPDERLRREYEVRADEARIAVPFEATGPAELGDGTRVHVHGACGNLGEVSQAMNAGLDGIGVYRTELLFLVDAAGPGEDLLVHHYREVCQRAQGRPVSFRLLDLTCEQRVAGVRRPLDGNPALGLKGVRLLLAQPELMRLQIRALLRLAPSGSVDALVPFVTSVQEIYRVRETIRGERSALLKAGVECAEHIRIGAIIEVPAAAFHVSTVASEVDFLVVAVDDLQQYLLAADRDNLQVADYYRIFHPSLFRLLHQVQLDATHSGKELTLFGEGAADPLRLPVWIGAGYRSLAVSPVRSPHVRRSLGAWTLAAAQQLAERVLAAETSLEVQRILLEAER